MAREKVHKYYHLPCEAVNPSLSYSDSDLIVDVQQLKKTVTDALKS